MKIIQLITGQDEEGHILYGLSDDGSLYEFYNRHEPQAVKVAPSRAELVVDPTLKPKVRYCDGSTQGWKLVCPTGVLAKVVPHPDDPSKCERC